MCNCNNNSNCGCNPNPCVTTNCACPVYISSDCVSDVKADFSCLNIESNLTLTETFEAIDQAVCDKIAEVTNYISLVNVGEGAQVYKGINGIGQKEIRSITGSSLVTVNQDTTEIQIAVDEETLTDFVENLIPEIQVPNRFVPSSIYCDVSPTAYYLFDYITSNGDRQKFVTGGLSNSRTGEIGIIDTDDVYKALISLKLDVTESYHAKKVLDLITGVNSINVQSTLPTVFVTGYTGEDVLSLRDSTGSAIPYRLVSITQDPVVFNIEVSSDYIGAHFNGIVSITKLSPVQVKPASALQGEDIDHTCPIIM